MDRIAPCAFCDIVAGQLPATIVAASELAIAFLDVRQFHPGHVLVVPRAHVIDIRAADDQTVAAVCTLVARVSRAVGQVFPSEGLSVWHSAGAAAGQEVQHMHVHVHPRIQGDGVLPIYPHAPATPKRPTLNDWGAQLRKAMASVEREGES